MTKLPPDAFLPSGGLDTELRASLAGLPSIDSLSVISPLSLSRAANQEVDLHSLGGPPPPPPQQQPRLNTTVINNPAARPRTYSPLSPTLSAGPPQAQPPQFLSPHLLPTSTNIHYQLAQQKQQRSASLSPTRQSARSRDGRLPGASGVRLPRALSARPRPTDYRPSITSAPQQQPVPGLPAPLVTNGLTSPTAMAGQPIPRSVSVDAASAPHSDQIIHRLFKHNQKVTEMWESERRYNEANRARLEEMYREQWIIMEEDRSRWDEERNALVNRVHLLQEQVAELEAALVAQCHNTGKSIPHRHGNFGLDGMQSVRGGGWESLNGSLYSPTTFRSRQEAHDASTRGPPNAHHQAPPDNISPLSLRAQPVGGPGARISPPRYSDLTTFQALDSYIRPGPAMTTRSSQSEEIPAAEQHPVPTIDIGEIDPKLEGVSLKATAVQRPTFSLAPSPPSTKSPPTETSTSSETSTKPRVSREETLLMLRANESDRLRMHAGHTPNHSVTFIDRNLLAAGQAVTFGMGGSPAMAQTTLAEANESLTIMDDNAGVVQPPHGLGILEAVAEAEEEAETDPPELVDDGPDDNTPLKGPLMLRNMPAHDEVFLGKLNQKLENLSPSETLPTVLAAASDTSVSEVSAALAQAGIGKTGGDGATDACEHHGSGSGSGSGRSSKGSPKGEEVEVPLKLKISNNFGAPLGQFR